MKRADIYEIAGNYRTSVKMIAKFYGAHLKDSHSEVLAVDQTVRAKNPNVSLDRFGREDLKVTSLADASAD
jgi:hypothetical protein